MTGKQEEGKRKRRSIEEEGKSKTEEIKNVIRGKEEEGRVDARVSDKGENGKIRGMGE